MDPLGETLTTPPILMVWEFIMEPYRNGLFRFIDNSDPQFTKGSVLTRTRTGSDGPDPFLTLLGRGGYGSSEFPNSGP